MFKALAARLGGAGGYAVGGPAVFALHPMQVARFLEESWAARPGGVAAPPLLDVPGPLIPFERTSGIPAPSPPLLWEHLIYAYMVENTRVYEIFRRVLEEFLYGERLGIPSADSQRWLRTTEQLFYSAEAPFQIFSLTSWVRPDIRAVRRNAYFRMFAMDLNHGTDDNRPYPYPRAVASNTEFVPTFEQLLREVWVGVENERNISGPVQTDAGVIANLARALYDMLTVRRRDGNLTRDELLHSSTMSWFHLTLSFNSPIVEDLESQASSPEERLFKIGARVGLPAHSHSGAYFRLAEDVSLILRGIEGANFNTPGNARALYVAPTAPPRDVYDAMLAIISDWSIATGRDMKARRVSVAPPQPQPIRPAARPIAPPVPTVSGDGRTAMTRESVAP